MILSLRYDLDPIQISLEIHNNPNKEVESHPFSTGEVDLAMKKDGE